MTFPLVHGTHASLCTTVTRKHHSFLSRISHSHTNPKAHTKGKIKLGMQTAQILSAICHLNGILLFAAPTTVHQGTFYSVVLHQ